MNLGLQNAWKTIYRYLTVWYMVPAIPSIVYEPYVYHLRVLLLLPADFSAQRYFEAFLYCLGNIVSRNYHVLSNFRWRERKDWFGHYFYNDIEWKGYPWDLTTYPSVWYFIFFTLATSMPIRVMVLRGGSNLLLVRGMMAVLDGLMLSPILMQHLFAKGSPLWIVLIYI